MSVARECSLIDSSAEIYIPRFLKGSSTEEDSELCWESVLQEGSELSPTTLQVTVKFNIKKKKRSRVYFSN